MMFRKNKMLLNIVIDFVMLTAMALVSISGFILEIVIPSRHAVKFQGATPWSSQLLGFGRHDWGNIHLWAGIVLVILLAIHILLHINMVSAFIKKKCPNHILRVLFYNEPLNLYTLLHIPLSKNNVQHPTSNHDNQNGVHHLS